MNKLQNINKNLHKSILKKKDEIIKKRQTKWYIDFQSYRINILKKDFFEELTNFDESIKDISQIELTFVDRNKFDADLCIKLPTLLAKYKRDYTKDIVPKLINFIKNSTKLNNKIAKLEWIWIYLNISLKDSFLISSLDDVFDKDKNYWQNDLFKWQNVVFDYSSPNVAKHLHAWHIRSTIIWHVLANIYEANWYTVHRINHINDFWWFGFLIEWYNRWKDQLNQFTNKNDMLFFIYTIYRKAEKRNNKKEFENLKQEDKQELQNYFWRFNNFEEFEKLFIEFKNKAWKVFFNLESWNEYEVSIWQKMVSWSMEDFNKFYDLLNINLDYIIWESFYAKDWVELVLNLEKKWIVVFYDENEAKKDLDLLKKSFENWEIKDISILSEEIKRDIWAYVIKLSNFERFVVLKQDKSSIYATRDLQAILYRYQIFTPSQIIYEVWQEQREHFDKLFKSAQKIGLKNSIFKHIYHWFYIDEETKKKLSSRDWASNVLKLIEESIAYFEEKYKNSQDFSYEEIKDIAKKIAIWSIIFNDIKQDKKKSISIPKDSKKACISFEESWWAYVMYSIARANSILKKAQNIKTVKKDEIKLEKQEKILINEIMRFPLVVNSILEFDNQATLIEYILDLCRTYNSYYNAYRVIHWNEVISHRIMITKAFLIVSKNAMQMCNIDVPEKM